MFQQFAGAILDKCYSRGQHTTNLQVTQCLLDYCNKNIRFRPDPPMTELVKSPMITLCVPGAAACIPIEDCESHVAAYLALCRAMGVDVQMLKQTLHDPSLPPGEQEVHHLAGLVRMEDGRWLKVDPSLKGNSRVGEAQRAVREEAIDILDPTYSGSSGGAKFVAIGHRPIYWERTVMSQNYRPMFSAFGMCLAGGGPPTVPGKACSKCAGAQRKPKALGHVAGECGDEDCDECDSGVGCAQESSGGQPGAPCCAECAGQPQPGQPAPPGSAQPSAPGSGANPPAQGQAPGVAPPGLTQTGTEPQNPRVPGSSGPPSKVRTPGCAAGQVWNGSACVPAGVSAPSPPAPSSPSTQIRAASGPAPKTAPSGSGGPPPTSWAHLPTSGSGRSPMMYGAPRIDAFGRVLYMGP
jgi:hypothetical protein